MNSSEKLVMDQLFEFAKSSPKDIDFLMTYLSKEKQSTLKSLLNEKSIKIKVPKEKKERHVMMSGVISVINDSRLTAELSISLCKKYKSLKIAVVDTDRFNPTLDIYYGTNSYIKSVYTHLDYKRTTGLNLLFDALNKQTLTRQYVQHLALKIKGFRQLDYFSGSYLIEDYEYFDMEDYKRILNFLKQSYDIVILNLNDFLYDAFTCQGLMTSNVNLIGITGDFISMRKMTKFMNFLEEKQKIEKKKNIYVVMNHQKKDLPLDVLRDYIDQPIVPIKYSRHRQFSMLNRYSMIKYISSNTYGTLFKLISKQLMS